MNLLFIYKAATSWTFSVTSQGFPYYSKIFFFLLWETWINLKGGTLVWSNFPHYFQINPNTETYGPIPYRYFWQWPGLCLFWEERGWKNVQTGFQNIPTWRGWDEQAHSENDKAYDIWVTSLIQVDVGGLSK